MRKYKIYEHKRKKGIQRTRCYLTGMFILICILSIYVVISIVSLLHKTTEYMDTYQINTQFIEPIPDEAGQEIVSGKEDSVKTEEEKILEKLERFAEEHHFSVQAYPEEMIELLEKNPETEGFVLNYPLKKDTYQVVELTEALNQSEIPLFLQWDSRWGYYTYGGKVMGMTGCGPACLSMVALHLLQNPQLTPFYVAEFSQRNNFYVEGTGTAWSLMTQGAEELGLHAKEVSLDEDVVMRYLAQGRPIIAIMGKGDFTENGHFIVFVGIEEGKICVNDPNSRKRSEQLWCFEDIKDQIKNMWVYSVR